MIREHLKDIKNLRKQGKTLQEIGNIFNCTREMIRYVLLEKPVKIYLCFFCKIVLDGIKNIKFCENHKLLEGRDRLRELVRIRDNHTCQKCGKKWIEGTRRLDIHHLDEEFEGWDNSKKNPNGNKTGIYQNDKKNFDRMITYCHKCHLNLDSVRFKMTLEGRKNF